MITTTWRPVTNVKCGKRKYHDVVLGDPEHGDWTREEKEKWQCGKRAAPKPQRGEDGRFKVGERYYTGYYEAKVAVLERLAPVDRHVPRETAECGTEAGYQRHRRLGEEACRPCLDGHSRYVRTWRYG